MRIRSHADAASFLAAADPFIGSDPFSTSVIAVAAQRTAADPGAGDGHLWLTAEDDGGSVLGVAMHTPPFPLFVSRMPAPAATALAAALLDGGHELPGVNGACEATAAFLDVWTQRSGQTARRVNAFRMYRLDGLRPPAGVTGSSTVATAPTDVPLLVDWFTAFHAEALPDAPEQDQAAIVSRRIEAGQLHLWHDAELPVSVAGVSAPAAGVARISPVYTPPHARRRGYGAAVTAAASGAAIAADAEHVVLYADLANPTSNSIYQAIGFRPDHDAESCLFGRESSDSQPRSSHHG